MDTIALPISTQTQTLKQESALHIPLGLLKPSPTNPRQKFDAAKLNELADGIRELGGVFQPILARVNPDHTDGDGQPPYEIVAGERRWRASSIAGLDTVLTLVRPLTNRQALQIQLKENIDRESLHELEEAEGIRRLMADTGDTAEQVATTLSKGRRWIFGRLALLNLCTEVRELFLSGAFKATIAGLIARMPDAEQQAKAARHIAAGWGGELYSFRAAAEYLAKEYMLSLAKAPFDITACYPVAGPCAACPKRSGANPDLFDDVKSGDMCQDSSCYNAKSSQHHDGLLDAAREAGHTVLSGEAARKLMITSNYLPSGYFWFNLACEMSTSTQTLREIFGAKTSDVITLDHPSGQIVSIVHQDVVRKVLKAKGLLKVTPPPPEPAAEQETSEGESQAAAPAQPKRPAEPAPNLKPRTPQELNNQTESVAIELFGKYAHLALHKALKAAPELPLRAVQLLITKSMDDAPVEEFKLLYAARGWAMPELTHAWRNGATLTGDLQQRLANLSGRELGEILIETLVLCELTDRARWDDLEDSQYPDAPTYTLACELGITDELILLDQQAGDDAYTQVRADEAARLGLPDPTAAFVQAHAEQANTTAKRASNLKYRNAATGETWSGRGLQPKWLKVAMEQGKALADFVVTA
jgi:ParB/RepB/Spo0J family partition protein